MAKLYKVTDKDGQTKNNTRWSEGVTHRVERNDGGTGYLCSSRYIHAYEHPLIALLMNPIHANFETPRLWEAKGKVARRDGQVQCGCVELTTIREITVPEITVAQRVELAIRCALAVSTDAAFEQWANNWLNRSDRSAEAVESVESVAEVVWAARAAVRAAMTSAAAAAARTVARSAANAVAEAAWAARVASDHLDLFALADQVFDEMG